MVPAKRKPFSGHFCDLRTFLFALTNDSHGLDSGCRAFGVKNGKTKVAQHGVVTEAYISYNRQDVKATAELAFKLFEEYDKHPIDLQETKAYSPASIGKSYLRGMGVQPRLQLQPDFPRRYLGHALSAFYGGRTSAHIQKVPLPVVYVDYSSMYPTVNCHLGLWPFVIAEKIEIVEHCEKEIIELMSTLTADDCFKPETWKKFTGFACVIPDGDILPNRGKYSGEDADWQVAVNILRSKRRNPEKQALWFSLPDIAVSVILTGKVPKIIDAFRIEARGVSSAVKSISLRGQIPIDARSEDFFKNVVEERNRVNARKDLSKEEKGRLRKFLKVLANAASYGIYAEMNREEKDKKIGVTCYGRKRKPFICEVSHPDIPGEFCFPPMAALITGGARLMLALLEHTVTTLGGTYAMEDTDSMAIVATESGGPVPCPGELMGADGVEAIWALSWKQVEQIRARFEALNPYDRSAVPGSILKLEESNLNSETGERNQLYCYAISAKRYALFTKDANGEPQIVSCSQHGLGHLLNPIDLEDEDRKWIERVWLNFVREALGLAFEPLPFAHLPAIGRVSVSSPAVMNPFAAFNAGKPYSEQIKPFNFYLTCWVALGEQPKDRIQLIAPYEPNPKKWLQLKWIDKYTGKEYRITTRETARQNTIRVKTYAEALMQYLFHPEAKYADASGNPCGKQTVGRLQRRDVEIDFIRNIGKESNLLEEVEAGIIHSPDEVYTEYPDPDCDEWTERILPEMREKPASEWVKLTGFARRTINDWLAGRSRPHERNLHKIKAALLRTEA